MRARRTAGFAGDPVGLGTVWTAWWPLAASWLLMGLELPAVSAVMARLPEAQIGLAAYGGVVFPLALLIEGPIIMLLAASTALSVDWQHYRFLRRFMWISGLSLTAIHVLAAFTPLYDAVVVPLLGVPAEIREPGRVGLQIMTPWTMSIAYRRFLQGVLIRHGRSSAVGLGTAVRLGANLLVLGVGWAIGTLPGIVVGTAAVAVGVVSEAIFAGVVAHPVLRDRLRPADPAEEPLDWPTFVRFYVPLAITPLIMFLSMPIASAAMSRMPLALASLAVWPVLNGLLFLFRSVCFGFNEVVVALVGRPGAVPALRRFALYLASATSLVPLALAVSPLGRFWFETISALPPALARLGEVGLWLGYLLPALTAWQSLHQGVIVHSRRTRGVTESVIVLIGVMSILLWIGIRWSEPTGLFVAVVTMTAGNAAQALWLWFRSRRTIRLQEASGLFVPARGLQHSVSSPENSGRTGRSARET